MAKCFERRREKLLERFDALYKNGNQLRSGDLIEEFLKFVENQEVCRKRWAVMATDVEQLQQKLLEAQAVKQQLEVRIKHMRYQVDSETNRRLQAENERDELKQQILQMKNVLCNENDSCAVVTTCLPPQQQQQHSVAVNTPRSGAVAPETETDSPSVPLSPPHYDNNYSSPTLNESRRPSAPPISSIKQLDQLGSKITTITSFEVPPSGPIVIHAEVQNEDGCRPLHVSFSRPPASEKRRKPSRDFLKRLADDSDDASDKSFWNPDADFNLSNNNNVDINDTTQNEESSANSVSTVGFLPSFHFFLSKTFFMPEICQACSRKITFGKLGLRCQQCALVCHVECKTDVVDSCILRMREFNGTRTKLVDFTPSSPPYIPPLIFYCVKEIEHRGLKHRGLYRECGSDSKIKSVKHLFLRKGASLPDLRRVLDINTLCGVITSFLRSLPEPLITYELWYQFITSAEEKLDNLLRTVKLLPEPNKQTLAFLMLHFKKIADTPEAEMTASNLAVVLGPLLIGHSTKNPTNVQITVETRMQQKTLEALFKAGVDFWKSILFEFKRRQISSTPRRRPVRATATRPNTPRTVAIANKYKRKLNQEESRGSPKLKR